MRRGLGVETETTCAVGDRVELDGFAVPFHGETDGSFRMCLNGFSNGLEIGQGHVSDGHDAVTGFESSAGSPAQGVYCGDFARKQQREGTSNAFVDEGLAQFFVEVEAQHFTVAEDIDSGDSVVEALHAQVAVVEQRFAIVAQNPVAVFEPERFEFGVDIDRVFVGEFGFAPNKQHA